MVVLTQSLPSSDLDLMGQQPGHTGNASHCGERAVLTRSLLCAGEKRPTLTGLNRKEIHWLRNLECIQAWLDPGSQNRSLGNSLSPPLVPAFLCWFCSLAACPFAVAPSSSWLPSLSVVSSGAKDGVSLDIFGYMQSLWPGGPLPSCTGEGEYRESQFCSNHLD